MKWLLVLQLSPPCKMIGKGLKKKQVEKIHIIGEAKKQKFLIGFFGRKEVLPAPLFLLLLDESHAGGPLCAPIYDFTMMAKHKYTQTH